MTVVQISEAPDRANYEAVREHLPVAQPAGMVVHTAHELPDGRVQIVDVYQSREQLQAFVQEHLFPAFAAAGVMDLIKGSEHPTPYEAISIQYGEQVQA